MDSFDSMVADVSRQCLATRIRVLDRVVTGIYDEALRPLGVRITQMTLMVPLGDMGQATRTELARAWRIDKSTLSRNLARLIDRGWIEEEEGDDARTRLLRLTPAGREQVERALPAWEESQQRVLKLLGTVEATTLAEAADRLRAQPASEDPPATEPV